MFQKMCWLSFQQKDEEKILYLQFHPYEPWKAYLDCPEYAIPDYEIPKFPKGLATYHLLRRWGWTLISSAQTTTESQEKVQ